MCCCLASSKTWPIAAEDHLALAEVKVSAAVSVTDVSEKCHPCDRNAP